MRIRIATCMALPKPDEDQQTLDAALDAAGVAATRVAWDDPAADWTTPLPTVVRSTWNYHRDRPAFLRWCERASRVAPLWNPPDVIQMSTHKEYLLALAARGVPIVPSVLLRRGETLPLHGAVRAWSRVVVKPAVGAGSVGTRSFASLERAREHLTALSERGDVLIQPYLDAVDGEGERSLVWIDGALSHAVRKSPRFAGQREHITGPCAIADDARALAEQALAPWADRILYGRVDIVRDADGKPLVMELELAEPSLFFDFADGSADRFAAGVVKRLAASTCGR